MHSIHGRAPAIATGLAVVPARPVGVGRHRRRRRAVHRRQPPDPRAAPQREPQDPAVQQPDLRADQGPVLADVRGGQGHQVDPDGLGRPPVQPDLAGAGRRGHVRRAGASTPTARASPRCCGAAAAHRGTALVEIFQDCPIFNDGSFDVLRKGDEAGAAAHPADPRRADPLRPGRRGRARAPTRWSSEGFGLRVAKADEVDGRRDRRARRRPTTTWPSPCPGCRTRTSRTPSPGCSATSPAPTYDDAARAQVDPRARDPLAPTCRPCSTAATPGPSSADARPHTSRGPFTHVATCVKGPLGVCGEFAQTATGSGGARVSVPSSTLKPGDDPMTPPEEPAVVVTMDSSRAVSVHLDPGWRRKVGTAGLPMATLTSLAAAGSGARVHRAALAGTP